MKIFLDSANVDAIRKYAEIGVLSGVTTNPTKILEAGREHREVIEEIGSIIEGPVSVEVSSYDFDSMVAEAREMAEWTENAVIKLPMTKDGIRASKELSSSGIRTNITLVFSLSQALLASISGAYFVSPFIGRLDDIGVSGISVLKDICDSFSASGCNTKVLAASIRSVLHVEQAFICGAYAATVPEKVLDKMFRHSLTEEGIERFKRDFSEYVKRMGR